MRKSSRPGIAQGTSSSVSKKPRKPPTKKFKVASPVSPVPGPSGIYLVPDSSDSDDSELMLVRRRSVVSVGYGPQKNCQKAHKLFSRSGEFLMGSHVSIGHT